MSQEVQESCRVVVRLDVFLVSQEKGILKMEEAAEEERVVVI